MRNACALSLAASVCALAVQLAPDAPKVSARPQRPAQEKGKEKQSPGESEAPIHILFIGNSFTNRNDLPGMIAALARAGKQHRLICQRSLHGGYTLEKHWNEGKALEKIQSRKWDFVVLQAQSHAALLNRDSMLKHALLFDAAIKKNGAKTILYMTWADQERPGDQGTISLAYLDLSRALRSRIAPVGMAWAAALKQDRKRVLHAKDKHHPNVTGTYLAACVFYATIYGKSPEGLPGHVKTKSRRPARCPLTDEEARPLQAIAWRYVQLIKNR
jgi:hypothetical protein